MITFQPQSGFSLVETLVAITVLLIVIVGPMTIITSTTRSTSFARDQVIAFFLAQEGAELAQKARDDIILDAFDGGSGTWSGFTDAASGEFRYCFDSTGCGLEILDDAAGSIAAPVQCSTVSPCELYTNSSANERSQYTLTSSGNVSTGFERAIFFEATTNPDEIKVVSRVTWFDGQIGRDRRVEVETYLFNVYGN